MEDGYWIWSHFFKIRDVSFPIIHRYTLDDLDAMSHQAQVNAFMNMIREHQPDSELLNGRMEYILENGIDYDRVEVAYELPENGLLKVQYTKVLMEAHKAVEFKLRYLTFDINI